MDYLYSQLPEVVYDPADLTGKSPDGTIKLNIDNVKREILLDVLKTPGKLIINDPNNVSYEYDGSKNVEVDISSFFDVKIEYRVATSEDVIQGIPTNNSKVGDGYLRVESSGNVAYAPIPTPVTSSDIQKITSIDTIYSNVNELPQNASIGSIYPVMQDIGGGHNGIVLYEKKDSSSYIEKSRVAKGNVYVILDSGLLSIATTNLEFKTLDDALKSVQVSLSDEIEKLKSSKQDNLEFTDVYNAEDNKVVIESTLNQVQETLNQSIEDLASNTANSLGNMEKSIFDIDAKVDGNKIVDIEYIDRDEKDQISRYIQKLADGTELGFSAYTPKGDTGTLEIRNVITGEPGTEASVINVNQDEFTRDSHAILDIAIPRGYNADIKNVNVTTGNPGTNASASVNTQEGYLPGQVDLNLTIPRGDKGDSASIGIGATSTLKPGQSATVDITGTSISTDANGNPIYNDAILSFGVPAGKPAIIKEVTAKNGEPGSSAVATSNCVETKINTETSIELTIPVGKPAEVQIGNVFKGAPGTDVIITTSEPDHQDTKVVTTLDISIPEGIGIGSVEKGNVTTDPDTKVTHTNIIIKDNTPSGRELGNFTIEAAQGIQGETGEAATITIGKVEVGENNNTASVINAGTSGNAILNFVIPKGEKGTTITGATSTIGTPEGDQTVTNVKFATNDGTDIPEVKVYANRGEKGDTGASINNIVAGDIRSDNGYTVTPITITTEATENNSYTIEAKARDGVSLSHEWEGTSLKITSSSGTSEAVDLKGEKGERANIALGSVETGLSNQDAAINYSFDESTNTTTFSFKLPRGPKGDKGDNMAISKVFTTIEQMEEDLEAESSDVVAGNFVLLSLTNDEVKENTLFVKVWDDSNKVHKYESVSTLGDLKTAEGLIQYLDEATGLTVVVLKDKNGDPLGDRVELAIPSNLSVITESNKNYLQLKASGTSIGDRIELPSSVDPNNAAGGLRINSQGKLVLLNQNQQEMGSGIELPENISGLGSELINEGKNVSLWLKDSNGDKIEGSETTIPAGTGGGPGGGSYQLKFERITATPLVITNTKDAKLQFKLEINDVATGDVIGGYGTWKLGTRVLKNESFTAGALNTFDASEYVTANTSTKVSLAIYSDEERINLLTTISWTIQVEDIRIESLFDSNRVYPENTAIDFNYTVTGAVEKTIHFKLNGEEIHQETNSISGGTSTFTLSGRPHGSYLLEVYVDATLNTNYIKTPSLYYNILWKSESESSPLIGTSYRKEYYNDGKGISLKQYNSIEIPFYVADPDTNSPVVTKEITIDIKDKDGNYIRTETLESSQEILNTNFYEWPFKPTEIGSYTLRLSCKGTFVEVLVESEYIGFDVTPASGYILDFNPSGKSNTNEQDKNWSYNGITMTVSDGSDTFNEFDWQNGGYGVDENNNSYFCIKSGTYAKFNYKLFSKDAKDTGSSFKIIFKTTNVKRSDASFVKCLSSDASDKVGLQLDVHNAKISTSQEELSVPYSENDIIEFEYNVTPLEKDPTESDGYSKTATSHIIAYEDGVMARPLIYNSNYSLQQRSPADIIIGSNDCDVYIYRIRAYEKSLTDSDILSNFIMDAGNSDEMVARYNRNQIYRNANKILEPEFLAEKCPDLRIIMIEAPRFTNDKSDKVPETTVRMIYKNGDPILDNWTCTGAQHSGQGTSSNKYGYAGRNLDLIMDKSSSEFTLGDGSKSKTITLTRDSVPTDYLNIKVNIASSENTNNSQMAQRYNRFNPYTRPAKRRDSKVKDCMEFYNCVVFIKETGNSYETKDDEGNITIVTPERQEFNDNNWHFYAIGNVGDSKKTDDTRVDDKNDPKECVVEIMDYNVVLAEFPKGEGSFVRGNSAYDYLYGKGRPETIGEDTYDENGYLYDDGDISSFGYGSYEFRYEKKGISNDQRIENINAWRDFYKFVVTSSDEDFKNKLHEYFMVDSALYYYLFTERYTMVDNRAKNSFWHRSKVYITEEYNLTHPNTGCIVNNAEALINNGYRWDLCFGYDFDTSLGIDNTGRLVLTYGKEDTDKYADGSYIFRAAESTFFRRLHALFFDDLKQMFTNRETAYAWSSEGSNGLITQWDNNQVQFPEELWRRDIERKYLRTYQGISLDNSIKKGADAQFLKDMMNGRKKYQRRQFERNQEIYFASKYISGNLQNNFIQLRAGNPTSYVIAPNYSLFLTPYIDMYVTVGYGNAGNRGGERIKAGEEYKVEYSQNTADLTYIYGASHIQAIGDLSAFYPYAPSFKDGKRLQALTIGNSRPGYENAFLTSLDLTENKMLEYLDIQNTSALTGSLNLTSCLDLKELYATGSAITGVSFANKGKLEKAYLPNSISELSLRNLKNLETLEISYANISKLTIESSNIDERQVTLNVIDNGKLQELYLYGINWTEGGTGLLNKIYNLYNSDLTGNVYIAGDLASYEKDMFQSKWQDLNITYDNLIPYHLVRYIGATGEVLYSEWVQQGGYPSANTEDGTIGGKISTPLKESTAEFFFEFNKWSDNVNSQVASSVDIYAEFTSTIRTYTVTWWDKLVNGQILYKKENVLYGSEVKYEGVPLEGYYNIGTLQSHLFLGWDKSTGFIKKDINVYPRWKTTDAPQFNTELGKFVDNNGVELELHNMDVGQIHAIVSRDKLRQTGTTSTSIPPLYDIFEAKDYYDITLGTDLDFDTSIDNDIDSHIPSTTIVDLNNPCYFDGTMSKIVDTGISLFGEEDPSFTLAIDYKFLDNIRDCNTLLSCYSNENGSNSGFRLISYNSNNYQRYVPLMQYSSSNSANTTQVGNYCNASDTNNYYRGIVVITHTKGEDTIKIFSDYNPKASNITQYENQSPAFEVNMAQFELQRLREKPLSIVLGATKGATSYADLGVGCINWCKLWYENLGDDNAAQLASWYREKVRFDYYGGSPKDTSISKGRYLVDRLSFESNNLESYPIDSQLYSSMCFIPNNLLEDRKMLMTTIGNGSAPQVFVTWKNAGYDKGTAYELDEADEIKEENQMRLFFNTRLFKAFPFEWRQIIRKSQVKYSNSSLTDIGNIDNNLYDFIYIPPAYDFRTSTNTFYILEGNSNFGPIDFLNGDSLTNRAHTYGKFQGIMVKDDSKTFELTYDPSINLNNQVKEGDIWCKVNASSQTSIDELYIYLPMAQIKLKGWRYTPSQNAEYGWVKSCAYPSRTRLLNNYRTWNVVGANATVSGANVTTTYLGLLPCFSI